MENRALNDLALLYSSSHNVESFVPIYEWFKRRYEKTYPLVANSCGSYREEIKSMYEFILLSCLRLYNGKSDFENMLNFSLKRARARLSSKNKNSHSILNWDTPIPNIEDEQCDCPGNIPKKKEADQRQLIDFLLRSAKTDSTTTAIVEAFLAAPPSASPNAIAKSLGLHHEVVKRKLRALSRHYDANRFGDHRDYLAV